MGQLSSKYRYIKISHLENESKCIRLYSKYELPEESELYEIDVINGFQISGIPSEDSEDKNKDVFFEYNTEPGIGFEKLRLYETKTYYCEFNNIKLEIKNENELNPIQNASNQFTFNIVNYLGKSAFIIDNEENTIPFEVIPTKIHYEDDYVKLTKDIADKCSQLLLDYSSPTNLNFSHDTNKLKQTPLESFIFLRKFCSSQNIEYLMQCIKTNPDRVLVYENELKPFGSAPISKSFYSNPFSNSKNWIKATDSSYLPELISTCRKYDSYNTPANQFIKYALNVFIQVCQNLIDRMQSYYTYKEEASYLKKSLETILMDSFFDDIQDLSTMPLNNQVLQKREGYYQIFYAFNMLELAKQLDWEGERELFEGQSRNVALLYEYWLVFIILEILKELGAEVEFDISDNDQDKSMFSKKNGLLISLKEGQTSYYSAVFKDKNLRITFYYNRPFRKVDFNGTDYKGSYSRDFRPDYTLAIFPAFTKDGKKIKEDEALKDGEVSYIHFDAKYRVTDITSLFGKEAQSDSDFEEEKNNESIKTYNRGDLLKMHTYNDAIRRTVGSYVLYPGEKNENSFTVYDELLPGVGAFAIKPSTKNESEKNAGEEVLKHFIENVIEFKVNKAKRIQRTNYFEKMIFESPTVDKDQISSNINNELAIIGYVSNNYLTYIKNKFITDSGISSEPFYFYYKAIKNNQVYAIHKETSKAKFLRLTRTSYYNLEQVEGDDYIKLEPWCAVINSTELVSKEKLKEILSDYPFNNDFDADYYYLVRANFIKDFGSTVVAVSLSNNNEVISPYAPKVLRAHEIGIRD